MASVTLEKGKAEATAAGEAGAEGAGSSAGGCSSGSAVEPAAPETEPSGGGSSVPRPSRGAASKYDFVKVWLHSNLSSFPS